MGKTFMCRSKLPRFVTLISRDRCKWFVCSPNQLILIPQQRTSWSSVAVLNGARDFTALEYCQTVQSIYSGLLEHVFFLIILITISF